MNPFLISSIASGLSSYFGSRAKKRGLENIYGMQLEELARQQVLEKQALEEQLGYETGLARERVGEEGAGAGMTGTPTYKRLQDIEQARLNALRKLYWQQLQDRQKLLSGQDISRRERRISDLAEMYQQLGKGAGGLFSSIFAPKVFNYYPDWKLNYGKLQYPTF